MRKITRTEIVDTVWKACDVLRGVIDSSLYKDYLLTLLFLKYVSDTYGGESGDDKENQPFVIPPESSFSYLYTHREQPNIGKLINSALDKLAKANKEMLLGEDGKGMFSHIDFNSRILGETQAKNNRLHLLLSSFTGYRFNLHPDNLEHADVVGDAYMELLGKFAAEPGKKEGEFYTPPAISALLAKLVTNQQATTVYDPACGSGSLLLNVAKEMGETKPSLYGQEVNGRSLVLAKMNMYLHGFHKTKIYWGNTLQHPKPTKKDNNLMTFDLVVAHPPFSLKWEAEAAAYDPYNRFERGIPPSDKADWAFITHMLKVTRENSGKIAVLVPLGVLFRGVTEGRIRQQVIEENLLEAVIGLPAGLLYGTGIPVAIILLNKGKQHDKTLFIDASTHFESGKNQNTLRQKDINHIVSVYDQFSTGPLTPKVAETNSARVATLQEIREQDFNLNIPLYVKNPKKEPGIDTEAIKSELCQLKKKLHTVREQIDLSLKELGLI